MVDHYRYAAWVDLLKYAKQLKANGNEAKQNDGFVTVSHCLLSNKRVFRFKPPVQQVTDYADDKSMWIYLWSVDRAAAMTRRG